MGQFCTKIIVHNQNGEQVIIPVDNDEGQSPYQQFKKSINIYLRDVLLARDEEVHQKIIIKKEVEVWNYEAPLHDALPAFTPDRIDKILYFIRNDLNNYVNHHIGNLSYSESKDDFTFLYILNKSRDWKSECVICLGEVGKTDCCCDHKETVILRPCGHSICQRPCFNNYMSSKGKPLTPTKLVHRGKTHIRPHVMDISKCTGFPCPTCRTTVTSCFRAEDVTIEEGLIQRLIGFFNLSNRNSMVKISNDKTEEELQYEKESNLKLYKLFSEGIKAQPVNDNNSGNSSNSSSNSHGGSHISRRYFNIPEIRDSYWSSQPPVQQIEMRTVRHDSHYRLTKEQIENEYGTSSVRFVPVARPYGVNTSTSASSEK